MNGLSATELYIYMHTHTQAHPHSLLPLLPNLDLSSFQSKNTLIKKITIC